MMIDFSVKRYTAASAILSGAPICFKGCRSALTFIFSSELNRFDAKGVLVIDGAIAFTRISGASSAASERVKPYIEPLLVATCV